MTEGRYVLSPGRRSGSLRYFFHVFNGVPITDPDGVEFLDEADVYERAHETAALVIRAASVADIFRGKNWVVSVKDETGRTVYNLRVSAEGSTEAPAAS